MNDPEISHTGFPLLGAFPGAGGLTTFRVWAPAAATVAVAVGDVEHELAPAGGGVFAGQLPAGPGDDYEFVLGGRDRWPDPWSRSQPYGLRGPSSDRRPGGATSCAPGLGRRSARGARHLRAAHRHVLAQGTFDRAIARLPELAKLGVTAIEVMPIATFAGHHGWGYDGVYAYAPHPAYGGPEGFARLIEAAHAAGLGVILDVVYNHLGAGSDAIEAFGGYLTDRHETIWGNAIDYSQPRRARVGDAERRDVDAGLRLDGLRLDAMHSIFDDSEPHVMAELAARVKAINPRAVVISEMEIGDLRPIEKWGHDAQWEDSLHHAVHVLLTGEHEGYYTPTTATVGDLARELSRSEGPALRRLRQNHDQVGNRALGDRLRGRDLRLAAFCSILSPGTPMLFQGEEYDEPHPFQYFTDHIDPKLARLTREGRRREFSEFSEFQAEDIPDPQDPATFERSKLDPSGATPITWRITGSCSRCDGDSPTDPPPT